MVNRAALDTPSGPSALASDTMAGSVIVMEGYPSPMRAATQSWLRTGASQGWMLLAGAGVRCVPLWNRSMAIVTS